MPSASSALLLQILQERAKTDKELALHLEVAMWQSLAVESQQSNDGPEGLVAVEEEEEVVE
jgi:hypothetical protein